MQTIAHQFGRFFLTFAVLVAMAGTGFAHRVMAADVDDSLLAYVAAGGALADICGDTGHPTRATGPCDACRLVDGAVVPAAAVFAPSEGHANLLHVARLATSAPVATCVNPACPVRAPPVV